MADIELVIKISEDSYNATCNGCMLPPDVENVVQGIKNGTPLPKGHGAIVDLKQVIKIEIEEPHTGKKMIWNNNPKINDTTWHMVTPTIIDADRKVWDKE